MNLQVSGVVSLSDQPLFSDIAPCAIFAMDVMLEGINGIAIYSYIYHEQI